MGRLTFRTILIILFSLISINFISAIQVGNQGIDGVNFKYTTPINYSLVNNVNNSIYWDGHSFSFLTDNYVPYTGATGNVDLGNNNVTTSYGFFGWLGSIANRITKLFINNIDINGTIQMNGGNITNATNINSQYVNSVDFTNVSVSGTNITWEIIV